MRLSAASWTRSWPGVGPPVPGRYPLLHPAVVLALDTVTRHNARYPIGQQAVDL